MKKIKKDIKGLTGAGLGLGIGSIAVGKIGGSTAGLQAASGYMPLIGNIAMAGHSMRMLGNIPHKKKKR